MMCSTLVRWLLAKLLVECVAYGKQDALGKDL
jgi:hypothetical protein